MVERYSRVVIAIFMSAIALAMMTAMRTSGRHERMASSLAATMMVGIALRTGMTSQ